MLRPAVLLIILASSQFAFSQDIDSCFSEFMTEGIAAQSRGKYTLAIKHFEAARQCPDITLKQDSVAAKSILTANEIWRYSLTSALAAVELEKENALKAQEAMRRARDEAHANLNKARILEVLANKRANQAEASRLASLAIEQTDDGSTSDALLLGMRSMSTVDTATATIWRAFSNAAFANYAVQIKDMPGGVLEVHFDPYGYSFAARSLDGEIRLYEHDNGFSVPKFIHHTGNLNLVYDVSMPGDIDKKILAVQGDRLIHALDRSGDVETKGPPNALITNIQYDPRNEGFLTVARDFSMTRHQPIWTDPTIRFTGHTGPITSVSFSGDGDMVLSSSLDKSVRLWNSDGSLIVSLPHNGFITEACFSPKCDKVLTASTDGDVHLWNTEGRQMALMNHSKAVSSAHFSQAGDFILTTSFDATARIWSSEGEEIASLKPGTSPVVSGEISKNGRRILLATKNGLVVLCDDRLNEIWKMEHEGLINAYLSHDGSYVLISDTSNSVTLWNSKRELVMSPPLFDGDIWGSGFTPDGNKIWACSQDGTAWVCDLPNIIYEGIPEGNYPIPEETNAFKKQYDIQE
jgi:WD40 repeat protein